MTMNNKKLNELEERLKVLELQNRQYKQLIDSLTDWDHEFRIPLSPIIGFSKLLLKTELDSNQQKYVQKIQIHSQILLNELNKFRDEMIADDDNELS